MPVYEVDVLEMVPVTRRVIARDERDAREKVLRGEGEDISGVYYSTNEIVDTRCVRIEEASDA